MRFLGPKEEEKFFGLAIADTLITRLSVNRRISVCSTAAIIKYADSNDNPIAIGQQLKVDAIVSGTMIRSENRLFLNIQLTNIIDRDTLWANRFVVKTSDFLEAHDRIAEEVAETLAIELDQNKVVPVQRKPRDQETYQLYLKGRYFWDKRSEFGLRTGLACAEQVALAEPDFPLAYVGIADSYLLLGEYLFSPPDEAFPAARSAAEKALQLEPALSEAYASLAEYYVFYQRNWVKAEDYYRQAIELNPNYAAVRHWYAWFLFAMRRFDESLEHIEQAQVLDPGSLIISTVRGLPFYYRGEFDRAIAQFKCSLDIDPDFARARYYIGSALVHKGDVAGAIVEFEKRVQDEPLQQAIALLGYCYAAAGDKDRARAQLTKLDEIESRRYVSPYVRAFVHCGLDESDIALSLLEKAFDERAGWLFLLNVDPFFGRLRDEPRFINLLDKLRLDRN
jgi:Tfp pilus assembly protein PilF/TolB-like protein